MPETLYAVFADPRQAEKAAGALLDHGVRSEDLTLIAHAEEPPPDYDHTAATDFYAPPEADVPPEAGLATPVDNAAFAGDTASADAVREDVGGAADMPSIPSTEEMVADPRIAADDDTLPREQDVVLDSRGEPHVVDHEADEESDAKHGVSTTTPEDAASGAAKGAGIGLAAGLITGAAALFVPGFGLVVGAGALATALAAAALTAGAGAIAGGVTGYLKDQGVHHEHAERYAEAVAGGGALVAVHLPSGRVDRARAEELMDKYGGQHVEGYRRPEV